MASHRERKSSDTYNPITQKKGNHRIKILIFNWNRLNSSYFRSIIVISKKWRMIAMTINTNAMVSITEANQNFSKVARLVDELGTAVILKNNVPRYLVIDFSRADADAEAADEDVMAISKRLIAKNQEAYEVLAK
jgi:antitoxin Phd